MCHSLHSGLRVSQLPLVIVFLTPAVRCEAASHVAVAVNLSQVAPVTAPLPDVVLWPGAVELTVDVARLAYGSLVWILGLRTLPFTVRTVLDVLTFDTVLGTLQDNKR